MESAIKNTNSISKIFFSTPLFNVIFRSRIVFLDADSILRVKMLYESVKEDMKKEFCQKRPSIKVQLSSRQDQTTIF